ncbi:glycosyltransferase family 87 protein [Terriglobus roseus]|uniref:DUF2029 domain-containing protein n=1 Tax=Terriglobus roseus TaxID=392734 RepID=A0A1H4NBJ7_9BACT|nr:glycosyltransferase family 87 protein [Terriglobus roseus]SEB92215.1 Protein of unknown function [Terriglobus roseus]
MNQVAGSSSRRNIAAILFAVVVAAICLSSLSQRYLGHVMDSPDLDFYDYYFAAQVVHADRHADLYEGATEGNPQLRSAPATSGIAQMAQRSGIADTELYLYPPLFADLLTPLTRLPLIRAAQLWRAFNLLMVLGSMLLLGRLLRLPVLSSSFALLVFLAISFWPVHEGISLGQITPLLLGLWAVGLWAYAEEMPVLSAVAFALATSFKVTPLLLVPLFLLWREWRWIIAYGASLFAAVGLMFAWNGSANMLAFTRVIPAMAGILPSLQNKCLGSVAAWLYYGHLFNLVSVHAVLSAAPHGLLLFIKLLDAAFYGACLLLVWRLRQSSSLIDRATIVAIFALVTLVIAPVSWRHGYTVALLPFALLWADALRSRIQGVKVWLLALATVTVGSLVFDLAAAVSLPQPFRILFASLWPLSCALLCLVALAATDRQRQQASP